MNETASGHHLQLLKEEHRKMRLWQFLSVCFLLMLGTGCGEEVTGPPLANVTGKITWKGKPLSGGVVILAPVGETSGWGANARTSESGEYKLSEGKTGRPGVLPGTYRIVISHRIMPDGSEVPANDRTPPMESPARESLPPEYSDKQKSKLRITIPAEGGTFDFSLPN